MSHADIQTTMRYLHHKSRDDDAKLLSAAFLPKSASPPPSARQPPRSAVLASAPGHGVKYPDVGWPPSRDDVDVGERRNHLGGALLGIAGLCWVSTVIADGTGTLGWFSLPSVLLFVAGVLCLGGALWAFGVGGNIRAGTASKAPSLVDQLKLKLKRGEMLAQRLDSIVPNLMVLTLARGWHDDIYKTLSVEHPDMAQKFLDETDGVVEDPTVDLSSINPARQIVEEQVVCLQEIIDELEAGQ